jgi:hypothetical protein
MAKFHDHKNDSFSTVDVIDQIYAEHSKRSDVHVNLVSSRHLLGKDQYLELKNDINKHLTRE